MPTQHDEQRAIAEQARHVAREEQAEVAVARESLHRPFASFRRVA
jgi:hypothetical protein